MYPRLGTSALNEQVRQHVRRNQIISATRQLKAGTPGARLRNALHTVPLTWPCRDYTQNRRQKVFSRGLCSSAGGLTL